MNFSNLFFASRKIFYVFKMTSLYKDEVLNTLRVLGKSNFQDAAVFHNNVEVDGNLHVKGSSIFDGLVTANGGIISNGNVTINGVLTLVPPLGTSSGGTGFSTYSLGDTIYGNASGGLNKLPIGTTGQVLTVSAGGIPSWTTPSAGGSVTSVTSGTGLTGGPITTTGTLSLQVPVVVTNGGTGLTSYTAGDMLYATASNTLSTVPIGSDGQVLEVSGGVPTWATNSVTMGGDISGNSGNATVNKIQGVPISLSVVTIGQSSATLLYYNGNSNTKTYTFGTQTGGGDNIPIFTLTLPLETVFMVVVMSGRDLTSSGGYNLYHTYNWWNNGGSLTFSTGANVDEFKAGSLGSINFVDPIPTSGTTITFEMSNLPSGHTLQWTGVITLQSI